MNNVVYKTVITIILEIDLKIITKEKTMLFFWYYYMSYFEMYTPKHYNENI